jgi:hypothetical protein
MSSPTILQRISAFAGTGTNFRVTPIVPRTSFRDSFLVVEANSQTVVLYKTGLNETVHVPTSRIAEIHDADPNEPNALILKGRLQHVTTKWQWLFFEDKPDANSELGFVRESNPLDPNVVGLIDSLRGKLEFHWGTVDELSIYSQKGWVVFYDDEGRCFRVPDRDRDTILMAKRK